MELKANLKLRKVGNRYMLVDVSDKDTNTTSVHTLNGSAAFVWEYAERHGVDAEYLASKLCEEYEIDYDTAMSDVKTLLSTWRQSGLLVGGN